MRLAWVRLCGHTKHHVPICLWRLLTVCFANPTVTLHTISGQNQLNMLHRTQTPASLHTRTCTHTPEFCALRVLFCLFSSFLGIEIPPVNHQREWGDKRNATVDLVCVDSCDYAGSSQFSSKWRQFSSIQVWGINRCFSCFRSFYDAQTLQKKSCFVTLCSKIPLSGCTTTVRAPRRTTRRRTRSQPLRRMETALSVK